MVCYQVLLACDGRWPDGCGIAAQASGATPVYAASLNGHVEAVRALLGAGAAVNQAKVSLYHSVWENVGAGCLLCEVTEV